MSASWFPKPASPAMQSVKRGRGRPRKPAGHDATDLMRAILILGRYEEARRVQGMTHAAAIVAACRHVTQLYPAMRCSASEVRRMLTKLHSPKARSVLRVVVERRDGAVHHTLRVDPRPAYPDMRSSKAAKNKF